MDFGHTRVVKNMVQRAQGAGSASTPALSHPGTVEPAVESRTRDRVARLLLEQGPATAATLGERLGLSPAAVRRHLDALQADGPVAEREPRPLRGAGPRPPGAGLRAHRHRPRRLPARVRRPRGPGAPLPARDRGRGRPSPPSPRPGSPGSPRGCASPPARTPTTARPGRGGRRRAHRRRLRRHSTLGPRGVQLCQHHCPVAHVAAEFPQLCEAETRAFAGGWAPTSSGWRRSPTATASARRTYRPRPSPARAPPPARLR